MFVYNLEEKNFSHRAADTVYSDMLSLILRENERKRVKTNSTNPALKHRERIDGENIKVNSYKISFINVLN